MRPAVLTVLLLPLIMTACATPTAPPSDGPPVVSLSEDCAVIAAVAKDHYRFNMTDNGWTAGECRNTWVS